MTRQRARITQLGHLIALSTRRSDTGQRAHHGGRQSLDHLNGVRRSVDARVPNAVHRASTQTHDRAHRPRVLVESGVALQLAGGFADRHLDRGKEVLAGEVEDG